MDESESTQPEESSGGMSQTSQGGSGSSKISKGVSLAVGLMLIIFALGLGFGFSRMDRGEPTPGSTTGDLTCNDWGKAGPGYQSAITEAANKVGVHPALLGAIFLAENGNKWPATSISGPWPTSSAGAQGPFQIVNFSAKWGDVKRLGFTTKDSGSVGDFNDSALAAATYLLVEMKSVGISTSTTDQNEIRCLGAGYNGGPNMCQKWKDRKYGDPEPATDDNYHNRVWEHYQTLNNGCTGSTSGSSNGDKPAPFFVPNIQSGWLTSSTGGKPDVKGKMNVSGVVLHWTAGGTVESAVTAMSGSHNYVQLIVGKDGKVYQLLPLNSRVRSGSGDGNSFAVGIEIVSTTNPDLKAQEQTLLSNTTQFNAVIKTVQYLIQAYKIPNIRGNETNLVDKKGIFGHYQTQSNDGSWNGLDKGCQGRKNDPGKNYMKKVWDTLGSQGTGC